MNIMILIPPPSPPPPSSFSSASSSSSSFLCFFRDKKSNHHHQKLQHHRHHQPQLPEPTHHTLSQTTRSSAPPACFTGPHLTFPSTMDSFHLLIPHVVQRRRPWQRVAANSLYGFRMRAENYHSLCNLGWPKRQPKTKNGEGRNSGTAERKQARRDNGKGQRHVSRGKENNTSVGRVRHKLRYCHDQSKLDMVVEEIRKRKQKPTERTETADKKNLKQ